MTTAHWELLSYIVTVLALPFGIAVFIFEQRKERENEDEAVYQLLSDNYQDFLKVSLDNPDLGLLCESGHEPLTAEQIERRRIILSMLVSLFERAYLLLHDPVMSDMKLRRWNSWEDFMRQWCRRGDFRELLPALLEGEDPEFVQYLTGMALERSAKAVDEASGGNRGPA